MAKTFLTYQQQLQILEQDKQLSIPNCDYAKQMLEEISYYSLIGGYKSLFKHNASNKYVHGVTFDELVSAVESGKISESRIDESVARILKMKSGFKKIN